MGVLQMVRKNIINSEIKLPYLTTHYFLLEKEIGQLTLSLL